MRDKRGKRRRGGGGGLWGTEFEDALDVVKPEELAEFLSADLSGIEANPEFKERLRRRLWQMVSARRFTAPKQH